MGSLINGSENMGTSAANKPASIPVVHQAPVTKPTGAQRRDDTDIHSRPSTFVHQQPGGQSSMGSIISGNYGNQPQQQRRIDTDIHSRSSTRVHHGPGGANNNDMAGLLSGSSNASQAPQTGGRKYVQQSAGNARRDDADIHSRSSTRIHQGPGGQSSMGSIISGDNSGYAEPHKSTRGSHSANAQKNQQSTIGASHLNGISDRSSTRVIARPGGDSQMKGILFGGN